MLNRITVGLVSAAIVLGVSVPSAAVYADPRVITGNDRQLPASVVDSHRLVSLTVKKQAPNYFDDVADDELPFAPIDGIRFTLSRVNGIDVTTEEGRQRASRTTLDDARGLGLTEVGQAYTNADGQATFSGLVPGLYLLEEHQPDVPGFRYQTSAPVLILLPLGSVDGQQFEYDNVIVVKEHKPTSPTPPPPVSTPPSTPVPTPLTSIPPVLPVTSDPSTPPPVPHTANPSSDSPQHPSGSQTGTLASTGANVLWAGLLGTLLIVVGVLVARRRRQQS